jgi:Flp pilus assembly protein TadB
MKLLATYPSERAARRAVRALEAAGIDPNEIRVDAPQDDRDELKAEQHDEVSSREVAPGVPGTGVALRAAIGGSIIGIPVGGILGVILGLAVFGTHWVGVIACVIGFGVAGWVAMALWAVYSAATEKQEATENELRAQVIVGVHTNDKAEIERAQMILRGTDPHRMDLAS